MQLPSIVISERICVTEQLSWRYQYPFSHITRNVSFLSYMYNF